MPELLLYLQDLLFTSAVQFYRDPVKSVPCAKFVLQCW